jgi:predicted dehydrogenase
MVNLRVLIVGVGSIGERHTRCFQATGRAEVGICEPNESLRNHIADKYEIMESFEGVDEAMDARWDAAVIATPAHTHVPIAQTLAQCGVHLLIEKPLSLDMSGIDKLQKTVVDKNLVSAVAYTYRAHPGLSAMREKIRSGFLGTPLTLLIKSGQCFPFYRPAYRESYYVDRATGGGAIQDAATHLFNTAEWIAGSIDRVCADAEHLTLQGVDVEDTVHVLARQGSAMSVFALNQFQAPNELLIEFHGDSGSVQLAMHEACWRWADKPAGKWHTETWGTSERDNGFITQANVFLDAVNGNGSPLCTLTEGVQTLRVNMATLHSALETQAWVDVQGATPIKNP